MVQRSGGSYLMAGFKPAAIAFVVMTMALRAVHRRRSLWPATVGVLMAIFYYGFNAAIVVALGGLVAAVLRNDPEQLSIVRRFLRHMPLVAVPGLVAPVLRIQGAPKDTIYGGTNVQVRKVNWSELREGLVSGLPASAWKLSRDWLATPVSLHLGQPLPSSRRPPRSASP